MEDMKHKENLFRGNANLMKETIENRVVLVAKEKMITNFTDWPYVELVHTFYDSSFLCNQSHHLSRVGKNRSFLKGKRQKCL